MGEMDEMEGSLADAIPCPCFGQAWILRHWKEVHGDELYHKKPRTSTLGRAFAFEVFVVAAEQLTTMLGTEGVGSRWTGVTSADRSPF